MSKSRQRTAISDALAVGCLAVNVGHVTAATMPLESAFRRAWRDWEGGGNYRLIHADSSRNDIRPILFDSERRRIPRIAAWSSKEPMWLSPRLTVQWELSEAVEHLEEVSDTSWESWTKLTSRFLDYFKDEELLPARADG